MTRRPHASIGLLLALALAGCATGQGRNVAPTAAQPKPAAQPPAKAGAAKPGAISTLRPAGAQVRRADALGAQQLAPVPARAGALQPPPAVANPAFAALGSTATNVAGTVSFRKVEDPFFQDSAAAFRLQAALGPASHALVGVTTLDEDLYADGGNAVRGTTKADGTFALTKAAPAGKPFVVTAGFARGHRLAALAPAGATSVEVDEATTMVTELARWQLFPFAVADDADVTDLSAGTIGNLNARTRELLGSVSLPSSGGAYPSIDGLRLGAGHVLRNAYVEAFGGRVTAAGDSAPAAANLLSDAWEAVLGFKPLALTRVAGNGIKGFNQSDGLNAGEAEITAPIDAVADHVGNVYFTQYDSHLVSMVPISGLAGPIYGEDEVNLNAGALHTVGGVVNGPKDPIAWELDAFRPVAGADPEGGAPMLDPDPSAAQGFALYAPHKLVVERATVNAARSHLYFTQPYTGRVMLMPSEDVLHYERKDAGAAFTGQAYKANYLYCVAGRGLKLPWDDAGDPNSQLNWTPAADGEFATEAGLHFPTGLARDAAGDLWILDAGDGTPGTGDVLVVREADGKIFRVPLTRNGQPFHPDGALDLRLSPSGTEIYVADTERHWVFKFPKPNAAGFAAPGPQAASEITRVVGKPDVAPAVPTDPRPGLAGFLDLAVTGVLYPDIHDVSDGVADPDGDLADDGGAVVATTVTALLNRPGSICFDAAGDLLVGDTGNGRIRLKKGGKVYTVAGGLDTRYITGDSRLAYMPAIGYLNLGPADGNVLVTDKKEAVVRRLHTSRGTLVQP